jgi:siroheme synthase
LEIKHADRSHGAPDHLFARIGHRSLQPALRVLYAGGWRGAPEHESIMRYEEIAEVVRVAAEQGMRKVRLTGGEPLVRA